MMHGWYGVARRLRCLRVQYRKHAFHHRHSYKQYQHLPLTHMMSEFDAQLVAKPSKHHRLSQDYLRRRRRWRWKEKEEEGEEEAREDGRRFWLFTYLALLYLSVLCRLCLCICIFVYLYIYICICVHVYRLCLCQRLFICESASIFEFVFVSLNTG